MRTCVTLVLVAAATAAATDVTWDTIIHLTTESHGQVTGFEGQRSLAVDRAGNVWVAWLDQRTSPYQVWYRSYDAAAHAWQPEQQLTSRPVACFAPSVAADSWGNIHVAWHIENSQYRGIWYKRRDAASGLWTFDTLLVPVPSPSTVTYPALSGGPDRPELHLAWCANIVGDTGQQVFHREFRPDSGWLPLTRITADTSSPEQATLAADGLGNLCVAWRGLIQGAYHVLVRRRVSGVWQPTELISDMERAPSQYSPSVAATEDGSAVHVAWHGRFEMETWQRVLYRQRTGTGWLSVEGASGVANFQREHPDIAAADDGRVCAVWRGTTSSPPGVHQLFYAERDPAGWWSAPAQLTTIASGNVCHPAICLRGRNVHVAWYDDHSGNQDVYYLHGTLPTACSETPAGRPRTAASIVRAAVPLAGTTLYGVDGRVARAGLRPGVYLAVTGGAVCRRVVAVP